MKNKLTYYSGSELKWSTEDIYRLGGDRIKSFEDAVKILQLALEDNEYMMGIINQEIEDAIEKFYDK